jgi:hypothetical protein
VSRAASTHVNRHLAHTHSDVRIGEILLFENSHRPLYLPILPMLSLVSQGSITSASANRLIIEESKSVHAGTFVDLTGERELMLSSQLDRLKAVNNVTNYKISECMLE